MGGCKTKAVIKAPTRQANPYRFKAITASFAERGSIERLIVLSRFSCFKTFYCFCQPMRPYAAAQSSISCWAMIGKIPGVEALHCATWPVFGSRKTAGDAHPDNNNTTTTIERYIVFGLAFSCSSGVPLAASRPIPWSSMRCRRPGIFPLRESASTRCRTSRTCDAGC